MVVIAIIGILFAVAMPLFENMGRKDTNRAAYQVMNTMRLARQHAIAKRSGPWLYFQIETAGHTIQRISTNACVPMPLLPPPTIWMVNINLILNCAIRGLRTWN